MFGGIARRRSWVRALAALALLATGARALVPAGYMPGAEDGRWLSVVLCTGGFGPAEAMLNLETGELHRGGELPAHDDPSRERTPCVFTASALAAPPAGPQLVHAIAAPDPIVVAPAPYAVALGLAAPPPQATAPPLAA